MRTMRGVGLRAGIASAAWLLAGTACTPGSAAADVASGAASSMQADAAIAEPVAPTGAEFEGTMELLEVSLDADAVRAVVGSVDPAAVMAFPPERLVDAALAGDIETVSTKRTTLEIDGRMARWPVDATEGSYMILDGHANRVHVVDSDTRDIMTMDPARMTAQSAVGSASDIEVEHVGQREIRGFEANGYRVSGFMGGTVLTLWLSPELEAVTGPLFDVWLMLNPLGQDTPGRGALVRSVMVNPDVLAGGDGFLPAYTVAEFHDPEPGAVAEERLVLPDGYRRVDLGEMTGAQP
mgnify:CR=1 FL=1